MTPAVSVSAQTTTGTSEPREQNNHASPGGHETGSATTAEGHTATAVENGKGTTLKDGLARWTSSEKCPHGTWTLRWETPVNYSIDAPLVFTGSFRQALEQLFALYTPAEKPLYARTSTAQCLLRVTDRPQE